MGNNGNQKAKYESVKLNIETVILLRQNKEKTGVPISTFVDRLVKKAIKK